ncbi:hypothetical protein CAPTEDRAFT_108299 [Capitella teleta]|uniref:Uncharacterized protein n=1 Tax=Capitella teleta TaxID=283909 RepID=R7TUA9_CAPTE|nr:hypothetical protein CAPTEDRAFT_108299 [Capitella teleta]|eukprot:ELT97177.1 hypothetical protein CAPTEDRAFT_108299 [Capitella teleta]
MTGLSRCLKFEANIFDKSKCQHCFKPKELHSAAALECNKVSDTQQSPWVHSSYATLTKLLVYDVILTSCELLS